MLDAMAKPVLSDAIQDYLKEIYKLGVSGDRVTVTALARAVGVSAPSASTMVKKLAALGLLEHQPYRGVRLTPAGEKVALEVIRHHRLLELYLAKTLGVHVDDVHDEADRLEHELSEELEARIDEALGFPTHDPHGDPIPDENLEWPVGERRTLTTAATGAEEPALERLQQLVALERRHALVGSRPPRARGRRPRAWRSRPRARRRARSPRRRSRRAAAASLVAVLRVDRAADRPDRARAAARSR